jgi:hypothetical protein
MRLTIVTLFLFFNVLVLIGCDAGVSNNKKVNTEQGMFTKQATENYVIFSPMEGVLLKGGVPLSNAKIIRRLTWNDNEEGLVEEFTTDEQGSFSLPIHEEALSIGMLSQFVASAQLEVLYEGDLHDIWYNSRLGNGEYLETDGPARELICDLNQEEGVVEISSLVRILTKCRWANMPKPDIF